MSTPTVGILCVTHGRPGLVKKCLESCVRQNYPGLEIVVVVNPVDAVTQDAVRQAAPAARIIRTHRNLGFFPALNIALANTDADFVMIVDDDAWFLQDDAIAKLVDRFQLEPDLGAVTCNLEGPHEKPVDHDQYVRVFTTGFTMLPRRAITEWVGYIPDLFFRSAGETYLCTQLWEQRRPVLRVAGVRMYHALAQTGRSTRDWHFHGLRSQILCAVMREPASWMLPVLFSKFAKSLAQAIRSVSLGWWWQAWVSALFHLPDAWRLRQPISRSTRRLLHRLGKSPAVDLKDLPEWTARSAAAAGGGPAVRSVAEVR